MPNTPSLKNRRVYEVLRRKGMPKAQAARISNAQVQKDAAATGMAIPPTGSNALFNQMGIESGRAKRRRRHKEACTCGMTTKAATGAPGEHIAPGITRIRGNLCNVHGKYGPCDAGASAKKPKGRSRRARKPTKAKLMPEQRAQASAQKRQQNVNDVGDQLDAADTLAGIDAYDRGQPLDPAIQQDIIGAGMGETGRDGSFRLTASGREALNAARRGDVGQARDAMSRGRDARTTGQARATAQQQRQQAAAERTQAAATRHAEVVARQQQREQERAKRQQERAAAAKKPGKASSSGGGKQPAAHAAPAKNVAKRRAGRSGSGGGGGSVGGAKPKAPAKAPKPQLAQPLKDAASALSEGADVTDEQIQQLITNGLVTLNRDGTPVLTAAGQRATQKAQSDQDKAMFANMGSGGGSGGSGGGKGGGKGGGGSKLWPKGPSGKRTPQAAAAEHRGNSGGAAKPAGGGADAKPKDPHAPTKSDRAVADRVRSLTERENTITDKMTALRKEHDALTPSWGQQLQPKYRKEREAKQADLMAQIHTLRDERNQIQQQSRTLLSHPEGRAAMDRVTRQEIIARGRAGKPMPGDDVSLRMIEEQHGIRAPQPREPGGVPQMTTHNPDRARAANTEYQGRQSEARGLRRQALQADTDADRMEATNPNLARQLRMSAADNKWRAFGLETGPRSTELLKDLEQSGYRLSNTGRGITRVTRQSTTPKMKDSPAVFTVFKDSAGADRWLAITTTAYEDKDREIISTKAIARAVELGDASGQRGPLLYWHVPGLVLGDCDYQAQGGPGGRFLIEGGTFRNKALADFGHTLSQQGYQMSPGFVHADDQPSNGVYDAIAIYERSAVPQNRAANHFTRLHTKEGKVLTPEKEAEYREKAAGNAEALALLDTLLATTQKEDDTAQARNVVYKDAPDWAQALISRIDGIEATVKAFTAAPEEGSPEEEAAETPEEEAAEPDAMDDGGMDDGQFASLIAQAVVQAITPLLDIEKKMAGHMNDLKSTLGGYAQQKDDAQAQQAARIEQVESQLTQLTGDLPTSVMNGARQLYRASESPLTELTTAGAAKVKEQIQNIPAGLSDPAEIAAYQLIWGN